jgi:hypothetical protein
MLLHTPIIKADDLSRYADRRESEAVIPELVNLLVRLSVNDLYDCRIPFGESINQPGWDGFVRCEKGYLPFVPNGISYWEIGTGKKPEKKASNVFSDRTSSIRPEIRANATFVFVTPRSRAKGGWSPTKQEEWLQKHRSLGEWKDVLIIDGDKLEDWLREFPALAKWLAVKMGISRNTGAIKTPREHWDLIRTDSGIVELRSPSASQIESILRKAGFGPQRAHRLAMIGNNRISALRRHLLGTGALPLYTKWNTAHNFAKACLIGQWDGKNVNDQHALEQFLGVSGSGQLR